MTVIVDGQIHLWQTVRRGAVPHTPRPFVAADVLAAMDDADVAAAVLVPPLWETRGNTPAVRAAEAHRDRLAVMARPWSREPVRHVRAPAGVVRGYRLVASVEPFRRQVLSGAADSFWRSAERQAAPVMVFANGLLRELDRVAARHPDLRLIIDHFGFPRDARSDDLTEDVEGIVRLARRPNVAVKASALPCYSIERYPFDDLRPIFERLLDAYGHERVFWGSDLTRLPCSSPRRSTSSAKHSTSRPKRRTGSSVADLPAGWAGTFTATSGCRATSAMPAFGRVPRPKRRPPRGWQVGSRRNR